MNSPRVSVILPTHNRSALLKRSVGSVLRQGFQDLELIVVDDCSTEDIAQVLAQFNDPRLVYLRRDTQGGPAGARNTGISRARGEWIAFQDSDDEWLLHKLETQFRHLSSVDDNVDLLVCGLIRTSSSHLFQFPDIDRTIGGEEVRRLLERDFRTGFPQTWLVRRNVLVDEGGFDEKMRIWDDWDVLYRISLRHRVQFFAEPLVMSSVTAGSIGSETRSRIIALDHLINKYEVAAGASLVSRLYYLSARYRLLTGELTGIRGRLIRSLRLQPRQFHSLVVLFLTLLPEKLATRMFHVIWKDSFKL